MLKTFLFCLWLSYCVQPHKRFYYSLPNALNSPSLGGDEVVLDVPAELLVI